MHLTDIIIITVYLLAMLGVGIYFLRRNKNNEDYYVGGRNMGRWHVGLSVVATDVGGGFSIGLGGVGFTLGLSGSWMLFTGLIGAWLAAVVLIPKVFELAKSKKFLTFPEIFTHFYGKEVALAAAVISAIGYWGFSSSQILAGAKLASSTFTNLDMKTALIIMGTVAVVYTAFGGLKAVIYTDTVQWIILMGGLIFIGIPLAYSQIGGIDAIRATLPDSFLSLTAVDWQSIVKWTITIIPIWFVGMTLYQRIYASRSKKDAQKAWFIAGIFEWPFMAFMGILLGMFANVAFKNGMFAEIGFPAGSDIDAETGLPLLLRQTLPVGLLGLMTAAYFSAILSTADSCLIAASGNIQTDILEKRLGFKFGRRKSLIVSQLITLLVGATALILAAYMTNVLDLMLYSYAVMVSGLFVPVLGALFLKKPKSSAALSAMIGGGGTTVFLVVSKLDLPFGLDANVFGITVSFILFSLIQFSGNNKKPSYAKS